VAFSPDGRAILTGSEDRTARLWDACSGQVIGQPFPSLGGVAYQPDGKAILSVAGGIARLRDAATGEPIGPPLLHRGRVVATAFRPDGKAVLTCSLDGTLRLWDAVTGQLIRPSFGKPSTTREKRNNAAWWTRSVAFSPDGRSILDSSVFVKPVFWDTGTGQMIAPPFPFHGRAMFRPDGKAIMGGHLGPQVSTGTNGSWVRLWDTVTGQPLSKPLVQARGIPDIAFSPDGVVVLAGSFDGKAQRWLVTTGQPIGQPLQHQGAVHAVAFSADGRSILTGCQDGTARLWDAATGQPLGAPLAHQDIRSVTYNPDGRSILTRGGLEGPTFRWDVDFDLPDHLTRLAVWVETLTGMTMDDQGAVHLLDNSAWLERRAQLQRLGGPPATNGQPAFDPVRFGPEPLARARVLMNIRRWREAEVEFADVTRVWPLVASIWDERGRFYLARARPERAVATFAQAVAELPDNWEMHGHLVVSHIADCDPVGFSRACAALIERLGPPTEPDDANSVAWYCALGSGTAAGANASVSLAEIAVKAFPPEQKHLALNTLGANLYRAGRFEDAIRKLGEGIQVRKGETIPQDWVFLALAHHRLGHRDEARRALDLLRGHQPSSDPNHFWNELEIRLLRSEAEAVVLYDPVFPADPFAH
jgi:WD40 repeat protein/tetratricopeptide (TPR) repeat protein